GKSTCVSTFSNGMMAPRAVAETRYSSKCSNAAHVRPTPGRASRWLTRPAEVTGPFQPARASLVHSRHQPSPRRCNDMFHLVLLLLAMTGRVGQDPTTPQRFEAMAKDLKFFPTGEFVYGRSLSLDRRLS